MKFKNPHRIPWKQALEEAGVEPDISNAGTQRYLLDSVVAACCDEGCETEPDGHCEHGCPSVPLAMGII